MSRIERGNPIKDGDNLYRFYKSNLPAVVWDAEKNCSLAEFQKGNFVTKKKSIARVLLEKGYPQVSPFATVPPNIIVGLPGQSIDTGLDTQHNAPLRGENPASKPITPVRITE